MDSLDLQKLAQYVSENHPGCLVRKTSRGVVVVDPSGAPAPTIDQKTIDAWQSSPIPAMAAALAARERAAAETITTLKATAALALVAGGMSHNEAYAAGTGLVMQHAALIQAFILAGGNATAGQALLGAITKAPPAWWGSEIQTLFEAALV